MDGGRWSAAQKASGDKFAQKGNRNIYWDDVALLHYQEYQLGIYPIQMADLREIDSFAELCETDPSYKGGFN